MRGRFEVLIVTCSALLLAAASPPAQDREVLQRIAVALEQPKPKEATDLGCEVGVDNRRSDLCAQWKAADAAWQAAQSAQTQTVIGWIGLVLGAATMIAAIAAALYARRAAVATEATVKLGAEAAEGAASALVIAAQNAKAAEDQVAVAQDTARRQLRAYLGLHPVEMDALTIDEPNTFPELRYIIENYGPTPVGNWAIHWAWRATTSDKATAEFFDAELARDLKRDWQHSVAPHSRKEMSYLLNISREHKAKVIAGTEKLLVLGEIIYTDVFNEEHKTQFFYAYNHHGKPRFGQAPCRNSIS